MPHFSFARLYQGFGWVGEWATTRCGLFLYNIHSFRKTITNETIILIYHCSNNFPKENDATTSNLVRLETLYHADQQKTDSYILDLVKWLHHLITAVKRRDHEDIRSLRDKTTYLKKSPPVRLAGVKKPIEDELSKDEMDLLEKVS